MKKLIFLVIVGSSFSNLQAQDCFDFPASTTENFNDNIAYPAGSTILSSNGIDLIKPSETPGIYPSPGFQFIGVDTTGITFINQMDIDVSSFSYSCKELSFMLIYNGFAVDGDTVCVGSFALPPLPYSGPGFTVDTTSANHYVVIGNFDVIHVFGTTSILSDICISECSNSGGCFDFPASTSENFNDNGAYPAGSTILSSNGIDLIKPSETPGIYPSPGFQFINVDTTGIAFINQMDIDISSLPYACRELTFTLIYNGFAVDADTIFVGSFALPALPYTGSGFTVDTLSAEHYIVTGDFDVIHIFGTTAILQDICVAECASSSIVNQEEIRAPSLYPNPTNGEVHLINLPLDAEIAIYSLSGELIKSFSTDSQETSFDFSEEESGLYLVSINTKNGNQFLKFIKQ